MNMALEVLLSALNIQVNYRVVDDSTNEIVEESDNHKIYTMLSREVSIIYKSKSPKHDLDIHLC